jgi:formyltetrahydrofolate-dependent phosphoribosylglycinamide formyltransferase
MQALVRACIDGEVPGDIAVVISPAESAGTDAAIRLGVPVAIIPIGDSFADELEKALQGIDLVCLAGFTRLLPGKIVQAFEGHILNIHPALLPKFGGKGMYGKRVHEAVIAAGESESGCTVHWVTEQYDEGEIVLQMRCPVEPDDTPDSLSARVLALEHRAYPAAVASVIGSRSNLGSR